MNNTNFSKSKSLVFLVSAFAWSSGQAVTPVIDRYAYLLSSDVTIDLTNKIISFSSNINNCQQAGGSPPTDTSEFAVFTNNQFIGLSYFRYDTRKKQLWMISESNDLICENGLFINDIFDNGFEVKLLTE
ncbi:hypothetical protein ACFODZ_00980 [Marinicella sediminis]|uniref:Uncharacterized protein n=1 Tax=Marinicella sediminis TaxID=1792834 RepID=A0ABV7J9L5_9GAMM|nr:hypothetical protein [Marinicella sediminis]